MATQTLEQYVAEATNAYAPAKTAIQTQLGALDSNYATGEQKINRNYEQQQAQLESQRNQAAEASSLAAAASGGAFGGQGNIARRKYYEQTFVPAQTQLQTNKANELDAWKQNIENQRTSLNSQLANLDATANQQALQQYWSAVEAEKQREAQLRAQREAQASNNALMQAIREAQAQAQAQGAQGGGGGGKMWDFGNGYRVIDSGNGQAAYYNGNTKINAWDFLDGTQRNGTNWDLWNDIWSSGTRTNGVGSDTLAGFNVNSFKNNAWDFVKKYGYLNN